MTLSDLDRWGATGLVFPPHLCTRTVR